jgi:hypothetical protein
LANALPQNTAMRLSESPMGVADAPSAAWNDFVAMAALVVQPRRAAAAIQKRDVIAAGTLRSHRVGHHFILTHWYY